MPNDLEGKLAAPGGLSTEDLAYLSRMTRWISRDAQEAEDIAQETWLAYHKSPPSDATKNRQWLRVVARRVAARMRSRRTQEQTLDTEPLDPRSESNETAGATRIAVVQELVGKAYNSLPERYQRVVEMRFYEDLKPAHIGQRLGLSVNTVNSRLQRAQALLRKRLEPERQRDLSWLTGFIVAPFRLGQQGAREPGSNGLLAWASVAAVTAVTGLALVSFGGWNSPPTGAVMAAEPVVSLEHADRQLKVSHAPLASDSRGSLTAPATIAVASLIGSAAPIERVQVTGSVTDSFGRGLPNANLFAWIDTEHKHSIGRTDTDGSFSLWIEPQQRLSGPILGADGSIAISADAEGYSSSPVRVVSGQSIEIPLQLTANPAHLNVKLVDEAGVSIDNAHVTYSAECADVYGPNKDGSLNWDPAHQGEKAALGTWTLRGLTVGSGTIRVEAPGYATQVLAVPLISGTHERTIRCTTGRAVTGRLVAADRSPQAGVEVHALAFNQEDGLVTQTDANGRFSFTHLGDAPAQLFARSTETSLAWTTDLDEGTEDLEFGTVELMPLAPYRFRLVSPSQEPIADVVVMLRSGTADAGWARIVRTDQDGWAEQSEAPFDSIRVWPFAGERHPQAGFPMAAFQLTRGEEATFELELSPLVRWDVWSGRKPGFATTGSYLRLRQLASLTERRRVLPADGRLQLELPAGRYFASYFEPRSGEALMGFIDVTDGLQSRLFAHDPGRVVIDQNLASTLRQVRIEQTYGPHISLSLKFLQAASVPETEYELMAGFYNFLLDGLDGEVEVRRVEVCSGSTTSLAID